MMGSSDGYGTESAPFLRDLRCARGLGFHLCPRKKSRCYWTAHPTAAPLRAISDYVAKLVQRLVYYTRSGHWLSEEDKDWHCPLLVTLREKAKTNWRTRAPNKLNERTDKRKGQGREKSTQLLPLFDTAAQSNGGGSGTSRGSWQAAAGAWAAWSWRGAEGATPVTRERAPDAADEVQSITGTTGLTQLHTYR